MFLSNVAMVSGMRLSRCGQESPAAFILGSDEKKVNLIVVMLRGTFVICKQWLHIQKEDACTGR